MIIVPFVLLAVVVSIVAVRLQTLISDYKFNNNALSNRIQRLHGKISSLENELKKKFSSPSSTKTEISQSPTTGVPRIGLLKDNKE